MVEVLGAVGNGFWFERRAVEVLSSRGSGSGGGSGEEPSECHEEYAEDLHS